MIPNTYSISAGRHHPGSTEISKTSSEKACPYNSRRIGQLF